MTHANGICGRCDGPHTGNHTSWCRRCYNAYRRVGYRRNPEPDLLRQRERHRQDPSCGRDYQRKYRAQRPDHYRAWLREYRKQNPEKAAVWDQRKRIKRRAGLDAGFFTEDDWREILEEHGHRCFYCRAEGKMTVDHYVPLSRGGAHTRDNIKPACAFCNGSKGAKMPEDFAAYLAEKYALTG